MRTRGLLYPKSFIIIISLRPQLKQFYEPFLRITSKIFPTYNIKPINNSYVHLLVVVVVKT